ncbi:MAG: prepilin-type N-terminal cleavage/methylation domain-containing protein [Candidatus Doudnabacteria bacterium]
MNHQQSNQKYSFGFTLIELLLVIVISSGLTVAFLALYEWQHRVLALESARIEATRSGRIAMNHIIGELSQSTAVLTSGTFSIPGTTTITSGANAIAFSATAVDSSDNLLYGYLDQIGYKVTSKKLYYYVKTTSGSSTRTNNTYEAIIDNIDSLAFTYDSGTPSLSTQVTVSIASTATYGKSQSTTVTLSETVFLKQ